MTSLLMTTPPHTDSSPSEPEVVVAQEGIQHCDVACAASTMWND
jgi:hypothetical protein